MTRHINLGRTISHRTADFINGGVNEPIHNVRVRDDTWSRHDQPNDVPPHEALASEPMSQNVIRGEIREIDGEFYVIRDSAGNEVRIQVDAFARNGADHGAFKTGDEIEVELTSHIGQIAGGRMSFVTAAGYGHAKSLKLVGTGLDPDTSSQ